MAGAGYKLFATGDVLTAAQVNTYLMQQTVMVFADSAARTTALSGVLAEGMVSYLQDTNTLEVYNGSGWVGATGDITGLTAGTGISITSETGPVPTVTNAMATEITAKGDLIVGTGSATFDNLAAGSNGDTLVADSSATTGLRYQSNWAAGKNKFINGDFGVNQRNFSSTTTDGDYTFDRWKCALASGTVTWSAQTFTPGTAPVAGYEGKNFIRSVVSGQTTSGQFAFISQRIEDVRTFAGQTVTVSFWAKAASGTPGIGVTYSQNFGSGGSPSASVETSPGIISAITTSWARYSLTFAMPSISGKTIGTTANTSYVGIWLSTSAGSTYASLMGAIGLQNNTIDIWGVQIEAANTATAFQTATGTIQGELAACQRYFQIIAEGNSAYIFNGNNWYAFDVRGVYTFPVQMRTAPTLVGTTGTNYYRVQYNTTTDDLNEIKMASATVRNCLLLNDTQAAVTAGTPATVLTNNASASVAISAEL
jgi:hypothetical protein